MQFVVGYNERYPGKNHPDSVSSTMKPMWSGREANSGPQQVGGEGLNHLRHGAAVTLIIPVIIKLDI